MRVVTPAEMNVVDKRMAEEFGMDTMLLMENSARAITTYIVEHFAPEDKILFVVGPGNNGGDGWAAARQLICEGYCAKVISLCGEDKMKHCVRKNYELAKVCGVEHWFHGTAKQVEELAAESEVLVDAMFGTGFSGKPEGEVKEIIDKINESGCFVVSVDVPSCINALTGQVEGTAVQSDAVIALGTLKTGMLLYPAADYVGEIVLAPISIPAVAYNQCENRHVYGDENIAGMLIPRHANSFKGNYGKLGIIAGSKGFTGAACLAAESALRSGAGLITLAVPESLNPIFEVKLTEQMTAPMPEDGFGHLVSSSELVNFLEQKDAILVGPGLSMKADGERLICDILENYHGKCVADADALNFISEMNDFPSNINCELILTPHIGEAARLLGITTQDVLNDSMECAKKIAQKYHAVVVLKKAVSIISDPKGNIVFNTTGTNGMATGGSGDVLAGIIASLAAQGCPAFSAAIAGAYINGLAGELAAQKLGNIYMTPKDTIQALCDAFQQIDM